MSEAESRPGWMGSDMSRSQKVSYSVLRQLMEWASRG